VLGGLGRVYGRKSSVLGGRGRVLGGVVGFLGFLPFLSLRLKLFGNTFKKDTTQLRVVMEKPGGVCREMGQRRDRAGGRFLASEHLAPNWRGKFEVDELESCKQNRPACHDHRDGTGPAWFERKEQIAGPPCEAHTAASGIASGQSFLAHLLHFFATHHLCATKMRKAGKRGAGPVEAVLFVRATQDTAQILGGRCPRRLVRNRRNASLSLMKRQLDETSSLMENVMKRQLVIDETSAG
jgi:hypothetical protein